MVIERRAVKNLLFVAGVITILTIAVSLYAMTWSPLFGPERTLANRLAGPAVAGMLLVVGWTWLRRIVRGS
jgi:hypothetical protein